MADQGQSESTGKYDNYLAIRHILKKNYVFFRQLNKKTKAFKVIFVLISVLSYSNCLHISDCHRFLSDRILK